MANDPPKVTMHDVKRVRDDGFLKIDAAEFSFADEGASARRRKVEVLERGDSSAVLIHLKADDTFLLARQFRAPVRMREATEASGWTLEIVAGVIDPGETPEQSARREAMEEVGLNIGACEHIATVFPSPGGSSERIYIYYAAIEGVPPLEAGGGLGDERIVKAIVPRAELEQLCRRGEIIDAKTLIAVQWLMLR